MKSKILIADDHVLFNDGVKNLLSESFDIVAQVYDGKQVLSAIHLNKPELVLLDINLPNINGFEIAAEIQTDFSDVKIVFLSMYNEDKFVEQAKHLNVSGYMLKHSTKEELVFAVNAAIKGEQSFDSKLIQKATNNHSDDYFVKQFSLTPREIEIIKFIRTGNSSNEIAQLLFLSEDTIKTHRKNIYYKLGINKVSELIEFAQKNGI
jgi:DNA-binding NarL/FixJ family response regulator